MFSGIQMHLTPLWCVMCSHWHSNCSSSRKGRFWLALSHQFKTWVWVCSGLDHIVWTCLSKVHVLRAKSQVGGSLVENHERKLGHWGVCLMETLGFWSLLVFLFLPNCRGIGSIAPSHSLLCPVVLSHHRSKIIGHGLNATRPLIKANFHSLKLTFSNHLSWQ